jgi:putative DNA-invertase from lambdoid prophage Rac
LLDYAKRADFEVHSVFKETASGTKAQRAQRKKVMALAQDRRIDAILVTELTRWGRSTLDLMQTIHELQAWNVSIIAQTGFQFDISTAQGKLLASFMASLAEFERDLLKERVRSGLAAAQANGKKLGRQEGDRPKSDKLTPTVLKLVTEGTSYRKIAADLQLSKNTVMAIVKRAHIQAG